MSPFAPADGGKSDATAPKKDAGGGEVADAGEDAAPKAEETTIVVHLTPSATDPVFIRGDKAPLNWDADTPMTSLGNGEWSYKVPEAIATLEWKPRFKATWARGPNYVVTHGHRVDVYPHFFTTAGTVTRSADFQSAYLSKVRKIWTYLPPTYLENEAAHFPVLYMHDGQNLFSTDTAYGGVEWRVDETMNDGAESGKIREAIVIGVENTEDRIYELTPSVDPGRAAGGKAEDYLKMIRLEIKPNVDKTLRTIPTVESTGVMGSSLGGLNSVYAGAKYGNVFGFVGAMSPSTWWDNRMILGVVAQMSMTRPAKFYIDSGDSGTINDDVVNTADLHAGLQAIGYKDGTTLKYVVQPGAIHNETYWSQRLPAALEFLLGPGR